jgi:hypothetical protein
MAGEGNLRDRHAGSFFIQISIPSVVTDELDTMYSFTTLPCQRKHQSGFVVQTGEANVFEPNVEFE